MVPDDQANTPHYMLVMRCRLRSSRANLDEGGMGPAIAKGGKRFVYLRLVEAYRDEQGRVRHRVLCTLGLRTSGRRQAGSAGSLG